MVHSILVMARKPFRTASLKASRGAGIEYIGDLRPWRPEGTIDTSCIRDFQEWRAEFYAVHGAERNDPTIKTLATVDADRHGFMV